MGARRSLDTRPLLSVGADAKTPRGLSRGVLTGVLYMTPARGRGEADGANLCPFSTPACRAECIDTTGRGVMTTVQRARDRRRARFLNNRVEFLEQLDRDVARLNRAARRRGLKPAVRVNGTSDIAYELLAGPLFARYPEVSFYDYTKVPARYARFLAGKFPANYHLTFSRSERNEADALRLLQNGGNVAVVFGTAKGRRLPQSWRGYRVIDGDRHDYRPADARNVVVGLRAKGPAKRDRSSGFVVWEDA